MHYQGKRHQKISEIHARKQSRRNNATMQNSNNNERSFTDRNFHQNANNNKLLTESGENISSSSSLLLPPSQDSSAVPEASGSNNNNGSITESSTCSITDNKNNQNELNELNPKSKTMENNNSSSQNIENTRSITPVSSSDTTSSNTPPVNFHEPPDPLPYYIKQFEKVLKKDHLYCPVCEVHVNSEAQMRQHKSSLRHMNLEKGLPVPPRVKDLELEKKIQAAREKDEENNSPENLEKSSNSSTVESEEDKLKEKLLNMPKPMQYKCEVCNCVLNSTIQLHQHLASSRHKAILEGKPPKPRWMPYHKYRKFG